MFLLIVFIATSTLRAVGSARAATASAFTDGADMRGDFNYAMNTRPTGSAGKAGNFTSYKTSGATIMTNNGFGDEGCGAALPVSMPSSPYEAK